MLYVCVCVCVCVSTINQGHISPLHSQNEDKIANKDGLRLRIHPNGCKSIAVDSCIQGGPEKNTTLMINNFKKTRDRMKKLCASLRIKFFSQQDDTKIINFDEGFFILWPCF